MNYVGKLIKTKVPLSSDGRYWSWNLIGKLKINSRSIGICVREKGSVIYVMFGNFLVEINLLYDYNLKSFEFLKLK